MCKVSELLLVLFLQIALGHFSDNFDTTYTNIKPNKTNLSSKWSMDSFSRFW